METVADLVSNLVWDCTENADLLCYQKLLVNIFLDQNIDAEWNICELPSLFEKKFGRKPQRFRCKLSAYLENWTLICSLERYHSKVIIKASPSLRKIFFSVDPSKNVAPPPDPKPLLSKHFMDQFNCVVCLDVLSKAVESNCCQVLCCAECSKNCNLCPICRKRTTWRNNLPIQRVISNMPATCDAEGCKYETTCGELKSHQEKCGFVRIRCRNNGCQATFQRKEKSIHGSTCFAQILVCECGEEFLRRDQHNHSCFKYCEICQETYHFSDERKHMYSRSHLKNFQNYNSDSEEDRSSSDSDSSY